MHPADDKRALFIRVVDDIVDQIRTGELKPDDVLPTARKMAEIYDVASMTAQRALRELQTMGLTYGVVGKGTFVHPEAPNRVKAIDSGEERDAERPLSMSEDLADYFSFLDTLAVKTVEMFETRDKNKQAALRAELGLLSAVTEGRRKDLQDELAQFHARRAYAEGKTSPDDTATEQPPADEPRKRTRRSPKK
ncbi:MAG TPA: GntR family transcriptional regulator [Candidatus Limnocylindrales bacterium]|nr:GntR family transcriptional regulator [Candidatus Limnocylindrales bacterium]